MPRHAMPPRLYLDPKRKTWIIRHYGIFCRLPLREDQNEQAADLLAHLMSNKTLYGAYRDLPPETLKGLASLQKSLYANGIIREDRWQNGVIYFISCLDDPMHPIKIGFSLGNIYKRLKNIQVSSHVSLEILTTCPGSIKIEQQLHRLLHKDCIRGEWFNRSANVMDALAAAKSGDLAAWAPRR